MVSRDRPVGESRSPRRYPSSTVLISALQSASVKLRSLARARWARTSRNRECSLRSLVWRGDESRRRNRRYLCVRVKLDKDSQRVRKRGKSEMLRPKATPSAPRLAFPASSMCSPLERVVQGNGAETTPWSLGAPQVLQRPRRDRARSQARSGRRTVSIVAILPLELLIHT